MALTDLMTSLQNTIINAQDWDEFINGNAANEVVTRLNIKYPTLPRLIQIMLDKLLAFEMRGGWQANTAYHVKDLVTFNNTTYVATTEHTATDFNTDLNSGKWAVYQLDLNNVVTFNKDFGTVLSTIAQIRINTAKPSFKFGLKGDGAFDDNNNNFRGLAKPNEPWADENTGIGSTMFGRDNAPYAYLSKASGHGCVTYGVASEAHGAGACTGNPDAPNDGATYGYCSVAKGKDTTAKGRVAQAYGERCMAGSKHSYSAGFESESNVGLASHPNEEGGQGIVSDGDCAFSYGWRAKAYGALAKALGDFVEAYNGAIVIGRGINPGTKLINALKDSMALGVGVDIPTILLKKGDGTIGGFGFFGVNTKNPRERAEIVVKNGDKVVIRSQTGGAAFDLQGTLGDGKSASICRIEYTSPNSGQAYGQTKFYQNGQHWATIGENGQINLHHVLSLDNYLLIGGVKVLGGQQAAIADSTGTAADNARAINAILAAMRGHGLIAS